MTNELTPTQVKELKQALKNKNNSPHHRKIQALILYEEVIQTLIAYQLKSIVHRERTSAIFDFN